MEAGTFQVWKVSVEPREPEPLCGNFVEPGTFVKPGPFECGTLGKVTWNFCGTWSKFKCGTFAWKVGEPEPLPGPLWNLEPFKCETIMWNLRDAEASKCGTLGNLVPGFRLLPQITPKLDRQNPKLFKRWRKMLYIPLSHSLLSSPELLQKLCFRHQKRECVIVNRWILEGRVQQNASSSILPSIKKVSKQEECSLAVRNELLAH